MRLKHRSERGAVGALSVPDVLVLAVLVVRPWIWGGVGFDATRSAAALIALAAGWAVMRRGASGLGLGRRALWLLPAFLLGAWAFAQSAPMPRAWVSFLSPKAATLQAEAFGPEGQDGTVWLRQIEADARSRVPEAAGAVMSPAGELTLGDEAVPPPRNFTLSLRPSSTLEQAFWYAALLLAFLLVHRRTADRDRAAVYRATIFISFGTLSLVGILNRLTAPHSLLWLRDLPPEFHSFGPYVNPSHFGGAVELVAPWMLGYGLAATLPSGGGGGSKRAYGLIALAGACICAAAAVLAASKMAAAAIGLSYAVLIGVGIAGSRGRRRMVLVAVTAAAGLLLGALAFIGPLRGRIDDFAAVNSGGVSSSARGLAWQAALRLAADFRLTGVGFDAVGEILPAYMPRGESGDWGQLHNDYLEIYVAGGAVAAGLLAWLAAMFVWRVGRVVRIHATGHRFLPKLGLILGLVAIAAHEAVDFNLQIAANALLFVVMAAMCVSPLERPAEES